MLRQLPHQNPPSIMYANLKGSLGGEELTLFEAVNGRSPGKCLGEQRRVLRIVHTCNSSSWDPKVVDRLGVQGQSWLQSKTLSLNK